MLSLILQSSMFPNSGPQPGNQHWKLSLRTQNSDLIPWVVDTIETTRPEGTLIGKNLTSDTGPFLTLEVLEGISVSQWLNVVVARCGCELICEN